MAFAEKFVDAFLLFIAFSYCHFSLFNLHSAVNCFTLTFLENRVIYFHDDIIFHLDSYYYYLESSYRNGQIEFLNTNLSWRCTGTDSKTSLLQMCRISWPFDKLPFLFVVAFIPGTSSGTLNSIFLLCHEFVSSFPPTSTEISFNLHVSQSHCSFVS